MKLNKVKYVLFCCLLFILVATTGCQRHEQVDIKGGYPKDFVTATPALKTSETRMLEKFLKRKYLNFRGLNTSTGNVKDSNKAHGKEYLLESSTLWLLHLANTHQFKEFREFFKETKNTFYTNKLISYRFDSVKNKQFKINATGDDLRLMRALIAYDEATNTDTYRNELVRTFNLWAQTCFENGELRDFYSSRSRKVSGDTSLAYIDLQTLDYLIGKNKDYKKLNRVIRGGYLGDALPLYYSSYSWEYSSYNSKNLNTSEALEVLLQLARVNEIPEQSRSWLEVQLEREYLPNSFSVNGTIADKNESVANWALIAQIFAALRDKEHYDETMKLIWSQQITSDNDLKGGFGDPKTGISYSYNNLNVLLAADAGGVFNE